jgi:hypothetical protein
MGSTDTDHSSYGNEWHRDKTKVVSLNYLLLDYYSNFILVLDFLGR